VTTTGQFASNSRGVFGLNGLNLNAAGSNSADGSVITSSGKNVHLDSGTRMLIVAGAQAGGQKQPGEEKPSGNARSKPDSKPGANRGNQQ
jgi:hypothetical protein